MIMIMAKLYDGEEQCKVLVGLLFVLTRILFISMFTQMQTHTFTHTDTHIHSSIQLLNSDAQTQILNALYELRKVCCISL